MVHVENSPNALGFYFGWKRPDQPGDLYLGLRHHERSQLPLGRSLIELGLLDYDALADALAVQAHCPRLVSGRLPELLRLTSGSRSNTWDVLEESGNVVVFGQHEDVIYLAITDARAVDFLMDSSVLSDFDFAVYVVSSPILRRQSAFLRVNLTPLSTLALLRERTRPKRWSGPRGTD